jgi:predicted SAM-dependent methyltransferase
MRSDDFPPELDLSYYRRYYPDLTSFSDEELAQHYATYGRGEGRRANVITDRFQFVAVMPSKGPVLEIGPFCNPSVLGPRVRYFDVLDQQGLISRARRIGRELRRLAAKRLRSWRLDIRKVPKIDFVSPTGDLSVVNKRFKVIISSHCLEHQPDLIRHLRLVHDLLRDGGFYFIMIPDKRYCFDHFISESTMADIIDAHLAGRSVHTAKSVIEHVALTTHNDPQRHWKGDHGQSRAFDVKALQNAVNTFQAANGSYIDVHAWQFTPDSFRDIVSTLGAIGYVQLVVERVYSTLNGSSEFFAILRRPSPVDGAR